MSLLAIFVLATSTSAYALQTPDLTPEQVAGKYVGKFVFNDKAARKLNKASKAEFNNFKKSSKNYKLPIEIKSDYRFVSIIPKTNHPSLGTEVELYVKGYWVSRGNTISLHPVETNFNLDSDTPPLDLKYNPVSKTFYMNYTTVITLVFERLK